MSFQRHAPRQGTLQGSLFEAAPQQVHRLFFALMPDAAARERIAGCADALKSAHDLHGKWVAPERYHATLHFLGDNSELRPDLRDAAIAAAATLRMRPVKITLDGACTFSRSRERGHSPGVLRDTSSVPAAYPLWQALGRALAAQGFGGRLERGFVPHVTLLYQDRDALADVSIDPIHWVATEFVLVHSIFRQPDYRILGRWRLNG